MEQKQNGRILVVDDESAIRRVITRNLEKIGYDCKMAESVAEAQEILQTNSFELLLTDISMPQESGLELLRYCKSEYRQMGRLVMSGQSDMELTKEIINLGVYGYIMKPITRDMLFVTVENAKKHLALDLHMHACAMEMAERIFHKTRQLDTIMDNLTIGIALIDNEMKLLQLNSKMQEWFRQCNVRQKPLCYKILVGEHQASICEDCPIAKTLEQGVNTEIQKKLLTAHGLRDFRVVTTPILDPNNKIIAALGMYDDITERLRVEKALQQSQKLEAIGQLAAGIAHEINTPVQYIGDNLGFMLESISDLESVFRNIDNVVNAFGEDEETRQKTLADFNKAVSEADLNYLLEEIPVSLKQSLDGVDRIGQIVKAMKDYAHPGEEEKQAADINNIIETTLVVCKNAWKYVAEVETDFSESLPLIQCFAGELSQVFLNLIVNASHAIEEVTESGKKGLGLIKIRTLFIDNAIVIEIQDSGCGIPEENQENVFNHFFTTKERGKGTGQGLSVVHRVIVESHGGDISFHSDVRKGTTFTIRLPIEQDSKKDITDFYFHGIAK